MVDAHAHLDRYGDDLPRALDQIRAMGIRTIGVSMDVDSFRRTRRIAEDEPLVLASFGVHPWEAPRYASDLSVLAAPLEEASLLGEIGLDRRFVTEEDRYPLQEKVFEHFLDAAEASGRPVNLHTAGAEPEVLSALERRALPAVIVHWYSGPPELVDRFLDRGAYFTVGVEVLRSERIARLGARLPEDRILTETDNPGGWSWMTGEAGFPELLARVEERVAKVRGVPRNRLSARVEENFRDLLRAGGVEPAFPRVP